MKSKPNCYECKHRGGLERYHSCHSECRNPKRSQLTVVGNEHGRQNGWFAWPHNYDPVWLEQCDGFEPTVAGDEPQTEPPRAQIVDLFEALKKAMEKPE